MAKPKKNKYTDDSESLITAPLTADAEAPEMEIETADIKPIAMDSVGYSIMLRDAQYHLLEIPYNVATLTFGEPKIICSSPSKHEVVNKFRVEVAIKLF
jgi:hypothetical protein